MSASPDKLTPTDVYLQRHAALVVTNSRLRSTLFMLAAVVLVLVYAVFALARAYASYKPMVIRINDVGHAEAITYAATEYKVQEAEIKYFLIDFLQKYYGRIRGTVKDDIAQSLYFLTPQLADQRLAELKQDKVLDQFNLGLTDQIEVTVDQISIEDLRQQPYKATITYTKSYYTPLDHALRGRDRFTAHVQFVVMDKVPHNLIPVNPLGLTIIYLREDQAFTNDTGKPSPAGRPTALLSPAPAPRDERTPELFVESEPSPAPPAPPQPKERPYAPRYR
jgi:type IV secretory pathway TrbF-like protein